MTGFQEIIFAAVAVLAFVIIIIGIANYKKRLVIYEEYGEFFGPFKAYCALALTSGGFAAMIFGIIAMFSVFTEGLGTFFTGLLAFAGGILIYYLTNKKAKAAGINGIIKQMVLAGFGTLWSIELKVIKFCCFLWIISLLRNRNSVVIYED